MNPNPIKIYFKNNLDKTLSQLGISNLKEISFYIYSTANIENYTNFDDIYRMWSTPSFTGIRVTYKEVIQYLVKEEQNTIPLWIRITKTKNSNILLEISQRFRKKKQVIERNPSNQIAPFEIVEKLKIDDRIGHEKNEAIRILFFKRLEDQKLSRIIGETIRLKELKNILAIHFENYKFYPASYNHFKKDDERFSNLIIEKDFKLNRFNIFLNNDQKEIIKHNIDFDLAINYYLENELNWKYKGIVIIKNNDLRK